MDNNTSFKASENSLTSTPNGTVTVAESLSAEVSTKLLANASYSMPISELATLGAGVTSLLPALRKVTTTTSASDNLYRIVNMRSDDVLKTTNNNKFAPFFKRNKMAVLEKVDTTTQTTVMPINPATLMTAVALFSIEQKLGDIEQLQSQILAFLEMEKDAEIEADVKTLGNTLNGYKHNWDNNMYLQSAHKMTLDLKRTAHKNMLFHQKAIAKALESNQLFSAQSKIRNTLSDLKKKFRYYQLSLYTFAMASLLEIMLSKNFKEEYIVEIKSEIEALSAEYRNLFIQCSVALENRCSASAGSILRNSTAQASEALGKFINSIPKVRDGQVDEFLIAQSERLKLSGDAQMQSFLTEFGACKNPDTAIIIENMEDLNQIYNHTREVCVNRDQIYLVREQAALA